MPEGTRPWVTYGWPSWGWLLWLWRHTMCRTGVHLFDEVRAWGAGHIDAGMTALVESATGLRAAPALTGDGEVDYAQARYLYCDACTLSVDLASSGVYAD